MHFFGFLFLFLLFPGLEFLHCCVRGCGAFYLFSSILCMLTPCRCDVFLSSIRSYYGLTSMLILFF